MPTGDIEIILNFISFNEHAMLAGINRAWASTARLLQNKRQTQWRRLFLGVVGLYTWRSHVTDIKVMHNLVRTVDTQDFLTENSANVSKILSYLLTENRIVTCLTEKGALFNTIKLGICAVMAYLTEDEGPDCCRRTFICNWILFTPSWTDNSNHSRKSFLSIYYEQNSEYDELDRKTMMVINNPYDPEEIEARLASWNISEK